MIFNELNNESRRILIDMQQLYAQFLTVREEFEKHKGSMTWKTVGEKEYLYRLRGRRGHGKSLGPRSKKTELILQQFSEKKEKTTSRYDELKTEIARQSKFCIAAGIGRVPKPAADVARTLQSVSGLNQLIIVGTHALYAYEVLAGVRLDSDLLATKDIDLLWDSRSKIKLAIDADVVSVFSALKMADKTFERLDKQKYAAVNNRGFKVELLKPLPNPNMKIEPVKLGEDDDLEAVEINGLDWLLNKKPIEVIVIAEDGQPVNWLVPDPRVFVAHKLWLSKRDDRNPVKKVRDNDQAIMVLELCKQYLPDFKIDEDFLKNLPKNLSIELQKCLDDKYEVNHNLSPGF